jgi:hypothetical protein
MKNDDIYNYVINDHPTLGMEVHYKNDKDMIAGFFVLADQKHENMKNNIWRFVLNDLSIKYHETVKKTQDLINKPEKTAEDQEEIKRLIRVRIATSTVELNGQDIIRLRAYQSPYVKADFGGVG